MKIYLEKSFCYGDQKTANAIEGQIYMFKSINRPRDLYFSFYINYDIAGFVPHLLSFKDKQTQEECWFNLGCFTALSIFGLSTCYLLWFEKQCHNQTHMIKKSLLI